MTTVIKKIIGSIITILAVSCLVFIAFEIISGDPALAKLGISATEEKLAALRLEMGLERPLFVRFFDWVSGVIRGDFGNSYSYNMPVSELIGEKALTTMLLALYSFLLMIVITIPISIYSALHKGDLFDKAIQIVNQINMSVPAFFGGMLISLIFGMVFKLFSFGGYVSYSKSFSGFLSYMFWPAFAIAIPKAAMAISLLYTAIVEEIKNDYVRTAYSRGNSSRGVFYKHILKNACIPLITFLGMAFADMISGSIVIEQVFGIPGLGRILLSSIQQRDYPVVQAIIVYIAFFVIVSNLLVDILYRVIDPRVR